MPSHSPLGTDRSLGKPVFYDIGGRGGSCTSDGGLLTGWGWSSRSSLSQIPWSANVWRKPTGDSRVIGGAVGDNDGKATLYVTAEPGCSSLLRPDDESLEALGLSEGREIVAELPVTTNNGSIRTISKAGLIPVSTFLKIDVSGLREARPRRHGQRDRRCGRDRNRVTSCECIPWGDIASRDVRNAQASGFRAPGRASTWSHGWFNRGGERYFARIPSRLSDRSSRVQRVFWRKLMGLPTHRALILTSS